MKSVHEKTSQKTLLHQTTNLTPLP